MLSGLEKYIYSKIQGRSFILGKGFMLSNPFSFIETIFLEKDYSSFEYIIKLE